MLYRSLAALMVFVLAAGLPGCMPESALMPTPAIYEGPGARSIFTGAFAARPPAVLDLLYVTDREAVTDPSGALSYTAARSRVMTFGSVPLAMSGDAADPAPKEFKLGTPRLLGSFPRTPYAIRRVPGGITREPAIVDQHAEALRTLQGEVSRRLQMAPRKEVVIFVHGYNNSFNDAAYSTGKSAGSWARISSASCCPGRPGARAASCSATMSTVSPASSPWPTCGRPFAPSARRRASPSFISSPTAAGRTWRPRPCSSSASNPMR